MDTVVNYRGMEETFARFTRNHTLALFPSGLCISTPPTATVAGPPVIKSHCTLRS